MAPGPSRSRRKLVFVGFMGAGKSRAARKLSQRLGRPQLDADLLLEERLGEPIESFFEREGEAAFREREQALVLELLDRDDSAIVALGGGAVEADAIRAALGAHTVVYIPVDPETSWSRAQGSSRPLARDREGFLQHYERRLPLYESLTPLRLAWADVGEGHPVYVGRGVLEAAGTLWPCAGGRGFVVADEGADAFHGETLRRSLAERVEIPASIGIPPGEPSKSMAEAERVLRALAAAGMQRSDTLVALGGGVVGDLAGFCAATYQRGVGVVQVPTTVVAQVDSAYGGKAGVDLPEGKNYVGAFHQPAAVLTDTSTLATLPQAELRAGFAEILKTGLIAGGELWEGIQQMPPLTEAVAADLPGITRVVFGCARTKIRVVVADERDEGVRASLNLGHTFAHALEAATGYRAHRHGEAVALGLLVALRLSEQELGLDAEVRRQTLELLERHGLQTSFAGPPTEALLQHAGRDKKRVGDRLNLVLLRRPGEVETQAEVPAGALERAIDELRSGPEEPIAR